MGVLHFLVCACLQFQPLWKIWKSVGMITPKIRNNKQCSEPPTSFCWLIQSLLNRDAMASNSWTPILRFSNGSYKSNLKDRSLPRVTRVRSTSNGLEHVVPISCGVENSQSTPVGNPQKHVVWSVSVNLIWPIFKIQAEQCRTTSHPIAASTLLEIPLRW